MKITFLGTAAGEGYPSPWCGCVNCQAARSLGGRNIRARSALLINDDLLIDLGPDIPATVARLGLSLTRVGALLLTHSHDDHIDAGVLALRNTMSSATPLPRLQILGSRPTLEVLGSALPANADDWLRVQFRPLAALGQARITMGSEEDRDPRYEDSSASVERRLSRSYSVWPLPARHMRDADEAVIFLVREEGQSPGAPVGSAMLYGTDTGPFSPEAVAALGELAGSGMCLDVAVLDVTMGLGHPEELHMNAHQAHEQVRKLEAIGLVRPRTRVFAHHFSHYFNPDHSRLTGELSKFGFETPYDGLCLTVG